MSNLFNETAKSEINLSSQEYKNAEDSNNPRKYAFKQSVFDAFSKNVYCEVYNVATVDSENIGEMTLHENNRFEGSNGIIIDTAHWTCKTSWFGVDPSVQIYTKGQWANPIFINMSDEEYKCLNCDTSCNGCDNCNACHSQYVDCVNCNNSCDTGCTSGCTTGCTTAATATCYAGCTDSNVSYCAGTQTSCEGSCASGCANGCTTGTVTTCVGETEHICNNCDGGCFDGCAMGCQGCTDSVQCGTAYAEYVVNVPNCGDCNSCTACTACNGDVGNQRCKSNTTCSGCTAGCTEGTTTSVNACPACVNSCQGTCQNKQNGLFDLEVSHTCGLVYDMARNKSCFQEVTFDSDLECSKLFSCTNLVVCPFTFSGTLVCSNNNNRIYPESACVDLYTCKGDTATSEGIFECTFCTLGVDGCEKVVSCVSNCNTAVFSNAINSDCGEMHAYTDLDPITDTCASCDDSCASACQGCDGSCTGCDGCTSACQGCDSGCTSGCTEGCTGGCTTACTGETGCSSVTSCSGCTGGCTTGCTSACAGGCTSQCASNTTCTGCTTSCASGCTDSCASGCTGSCDSYDPGCTSCVSSCTGGDSCCTSYCTTGCAAGCTTACQNTTACSGACYGCAGSAYGGCQRTN